MPTQDWLVDDPAVSEPAAGSRQPGSAGSSGDQRGPFPAESSPTAPTERVRALEAHARHLETRNAELEHYLLAVSHSLKSSVLTIQGFLPLLASDVLDRNVERAHKDIGRIDRAARQLAEQLDDLTRVLGTAHIEETPRHLPMNAVVQDAVERLDGQLEGRDLKLVIAPDLPRVYGSHNQLVSLMQNLIENAAKFMGRQARPVVEIGRHATPSGNATFVRDNGMGIEAATRDRIFELFQRLHPEIEGTGVGLTLAKKIVDLHDGQIWLESAGIGHGTTFFVRLPDDPSKALPRSG